MPKKFAPAGTEPDNRHPVAEDSGWNGLRAALESGDKDQAERIAYSLGVLAPALPGFAIAIAEAVDLQEVIDRTEHAAERLEDVRRRLAAVRAFIPQDLKTAEERSAREAELALQEMRLVGDASMNFSTKAHLAALWCTCPELFGFRPGQYRARPQGKFGEWLQSRDIAPVAGWWTHMNGTTPRRTIRVVAAHSGK
jgi:hypothetical protein